MARQHAVDLAFPDAASASAFFAASAASHNGLFPGTLPTGDIPIPITATLPRSVCLRMESIWSPPGVMREGQFPAVVRAEATPVLPPENPKNLA